MTTSQRGHYRAPREKRKPFSPEDTRCRAYIHELVEVLAERWTVDRVQHYLPHDDVPEIIGGDGIEDPDVLRRGLELLEQNADELGGLRGPIGPAQRGLSAEIDRLRAEIEGRTLGLNTVRRPIRPRGGWLLLAAEPSAARHNNKRELELSREQLHRPLERPGARGRG